MKSLEESITELTAAIVALPAAIAAAISAAPTPVTSTEPVPTKTKPKPVKIAEPNPPSIVVVPDPTPVEVAPTPVAVVTPTPTPEPVAVAVAPAVVETAPWDRAAYLNAITERVKASFIAPGANSAEKKKVYEDLRIKYGITKAPDLADDKLDSFYKEVCATL